MDSYCPHRIEGEHIRPRDIERALQQDFPAKGQTLPVFRIQRVEALTFAPTSALTTITGSWSSRVLGMLSGLNRQLREIK